MPGPYLHRFFGFQPGFAASCFDARRGRVFSRQNVGVNRTSLQVRQLAPRRIYLTGGDRNYGVHLRNCRGVVQPMGPSSLTG